MGDAAGAQLLLKDLLTSDFPDVLTAALPLQQDPAVAAVIQATGKHEASIAAARAFIRDGKRDEAAKTLQAVIAASDATPEIRKAAADSSTKEHSAWPNGGAPTHHENGS